MTPNSLSHSIDPTTSRKTMHRFFTLLGYLENSFFLNYGPNNSNSVGNSQLLSSKLDFYVIRLSYLESASKTASFSICFQTICHLSFFGGNSSRRSGGNSKKGEIIGSGKTIHQTTQFFILIPNMIILYHKSLALMMKIENFGQNSSYFAENLKKEFFQ
jgi:hypothetical protein